jgi:hydroxyacyl-ACP dehydratase HTD2-like protein with hotdog domain
MELQLHELGLTDETRSSVSAGHSTLMAATIDAPHPFADGEALPLLWHWAHFAPSTATADLGLDGHPSIRDGPVRAFARRMWASGSVKAIGRLIVGEPAVCHSTVVESKKTSGRSGSLLIVTLEHRYRQFGIDQIVEQQTLVYRTPGPVMTLPVGAWRPQVEAGQWDDLIAPNEISLFRFSAVTFNSHRIHYDHPYATSVEGYPDLVVQGPYTALMVGESIRRHTGRELTAFDFRASAPLFVNQPFTIVGTHAMDNPSVRVVRNDGTDAMQATATLGGPAPG